MVNKPPVTGKIVLLYPHKTARNLFFRYSRSVLGGIRRFWRSLSGRSGSIGALLAFLMFIFVFPILRREDVIGVSRPPTGNIPPTTIRSYPGIRRRWGRFCPRCKCDNGKQQRCDGEYSFHIYHLVSLLQSSTIFLSTLCHSDIMYIITNVDFSLLLPC